MRILIVEDEKELNAIIKKGLVENGYVVDQAFDGEEGLYMAESYPINAIVLDIMLPKMDGLTLLSRVRAGGIAVPVIMLTAKDAFSDRIAGLDAGADDYLVKPFDFGELLARLRSLLRRTTNVKEAVIKIDDLEIDTASHEVRRGAILIELSAREYALLEYLAYNKDSVVSRSDIVEHIYGEEDERDSNVVDVYINYLRKKLDADRRVKLIQTVRGAGYMLRSGEGA
jgi:DNA-binding response OmpR family regulator